MNHLPTLSSIFEGAGLHKVPATTATILLVFAFLLFWHRDGRAFGTRSRPDLSTVPGIPLLGNFVHIYFNSHRHMEMFSAWRKNNRDPSKPISITLPMRRLIDITRPAWIEYVQKTNFSNYQKGPRFREVMHDVLGDGIFVADGKQWAKQRKATSRIFTAENFRGFISDSISSELTKLKVVIGEHADSGEPFDLADLFFRFTLESFGQMAFGTHIGALSPGRPAPVPFALAFDYAQDVMNARFSNPLWPITEYLTGVSKKMAAASKAMDMFAFDIIEQREKEGLGNLTRDSKNDGRDLLSVYMALRDDNGQPLSKTALRDSVMNLIIAGRDTTAQALAWTFFHLLRHPKLLAPLRAEADDVGKVDYDTYKTMINTLSAFNEGLRLHPSVPKNAWQAIADDQHPDGGPFVHAGDALHWCDWELGRFPEVWGPDASEFRPSRWIDDKEELKKESQWKFHAFNGGYRLCLGQTLAVYEATCVMSTIIRDFDLHFAPGYLESVEMVACEDTPRYANSLTLPMNAPLRVTASRRPL